MTVTSPAEVTTAKVTADLTYRAGRYFTPNYGDDQPGASVLYEVPHREHRRLADIIVVRHYNDGPRLAGIEVKATRADLMTELRNPGKAKAWIPHVNEWWIAAPDGLVDPDELPAGWGLLVPHKKVQMRVVRQADTKDVESIPMWLLHELGKKMDSCRRAEVLRTRAALRDELYDAKRALAAAEADHGVTRVDRAIEQDARMFQTLLDAAGARRHTVLSPDGINTPAGQAILAALGGLASLHRQTAHATRIAGSVRRQLADALQLLDRAGPDEQREPA